VQEVFSVSNEVAAELATIGDGVLGRAVTALASFSRP